MNVVLQNTYEKIDILWSHFPKNFLLFVVCFTMNIFKFLIVLNSKLSSNRAKKGFVEMRFIIFYNKSDEFNGGTLVLLGKLPTVSCLNWIKSVSY